MSYTPKTDDEIKQLALDVLGNVVFTSDHVRSPEEVTMVFMILPLMLPEQIEELAQNKISLFYEAYKKAGPKGINGYPMFFSCNMLNDTDHKRLREKLVAIRSAMESV